MLAESPKYPALYDADSGVVFSHGRAEVTEDQAVKLAARRFVDGILIEGKPAKEWARDRGRDDSDPAPDTAVEDAPPLPESDAAQDTKTTRKAR